MVHNSQDVGIKALEIYFPSQVISILSLRCIRLTWCSVLTNVILRNTKV